MPMVSGIAGIPLQPNDLSVELVAEEPAVVLAEGTGGAHHFELPLGHRLLFVGKLFNPSMRQRRSSQRISSNTRIISILCAIPRRHRQFFMRAGVSQLSRQQGDP